MSKFTQEIPANSALRQHSPAPTVKSAVKSIWSTASDLAQNFAGNAANPHHSYSMGNTFERGNQQSQDDAPETGPTLDATQVRLVFDADGVCIGQSAAVADALGHYFEPREGDAKALLSSQLCLETVEQQFTLADISDKPQTAVDNLRKTTASALGKVPFEFQAGNEASMASLVFSLSDDGSYQGRAINAGDCMIAIYHAEDGSVELVNPVVHYYKDPSIDDDKVREIHTPISTERAIVELVQVRDLALKAGDVAFLMSDGYWDELPIASVDTAIVGQSSNAGASADATLDIITKTTSIDTSVITQICAQVKKDITHPDANDFRQALHQFMLATTSKKRADFKEVYETVSAIDSRDTRIIKDWLAELKSDPANDRFITIVEEFIADSQNGDGWTVTVGDELGKLQCAFTAKAFGDDCALQVVLVPAPTLEVIRRGIDQGGLKQLLGRVTGLQQVEFDGCILQLLNEKRDGVLLYSPLQVQQAYQTMAPELGLRISHAILNICSVNFVTTIEQQLSDDKPRNKQIITAIHKDMITALHDNRQLDRLLGIIASTPLPTPLLGGFFGNPYSDLQVNILEQIKFNREHDQEYQAHGYDNAFYDEVHHAANLGYLNVLEELLKRHPRKVDCKGEYDRTPLNMAIFRLNSDVVKFLLDKGANPNLQTTLEGNREAALHILITKASSAKGDVVMQAIKAIANELLNSRHHKIDFDLISKAGHTVFGSALYHLQRWGDESAGICMLSNILLDSKQLNADQEGQLRVAMPESARTAQLGAGASAVEDENPKAEVP